MEYTTADSINRGKKRLNYYFKLQKCLNSGVLEKINETTVTSAITSGSTKMLQISNVKLISVFNHTCFHTIV